MLNLIALTSFMNAALWTTGCGAAFVVLHNNKHAQSHGHGFVSLGAPILEDNMNHRTYFNKSLLLKSNKSSDSEEEPSSIQSNKSSTIPEPTHPPSSSQESQPQTQEEFLEAEAQAGAEKVRQMSIEERTKRAMLAEATEDRMIVLTDELEKLLGEDGLPATVEDREEVVMLAKQIKAAQEQYRALVNGGADPMLDMEL